MRTMCSFFCVLFASGIALSADTTSALTPSVSPAETTATAATTAEVLPVKHPDTIANASAVSNATITWSGMAELRLRDDILSNYRADGKIAQSANSSYRIAYMFGVTARPSDKVTLRFEIANDCNDWYAPETVKNFIDNYWTKRNQLMPWVDLAYAEWNPGAVYVQAGIIPVKETPLMDLLGVSMFFDRDYKMAAQIRWGSVTNGSRPGLRLGVPIFKGPVSLCLEGFASALAIPEINAGLDSMKANPIAAHLQLDIPVTVQQLTIVPQVFVVPNRTYNMANGESDVEFGAGFNAGYSIGTDVKFRAGFGYARNSNRNSYKTTTTPKTVFDTVYNNFGDPFASPIRLDSTMLDSVLFDRWATNMNVGTSVKMGPGILDFDFNVSNEQDGYDSKTDDWFTFFEIKYEWMLSKNYVLMPRVKVYFTEPKSTIAGIKFNNMATTIPELILRGEF